MKQSKSKPGSVVAKVKKAPVVVHVGKVKGAHVPLSDAAAKFVDTGCVILSRQFDRGDITLVTALQTANGYLPVTDRDRVLQRAKAEGVAAMLCWFADMERLDELTAFCQSNSGFAYFIAGEQTCTATQLSYVTYHHLHRHYIPYTYTSFCRNTPR